VIFKVDTDSTSLYETYPLDAVTYIDGFKEYMGYIETIEIKSITCSLTSFNGPGDQTLTNGVLTVSNENGTESQAVATIPTELLQHLLNTEKTLDIIEAGANLAEDLLKNDPHKCRGIFTGDVSSSPVDFTMKFHFEVTVTGSML